MDNQADLYAEKYGVLEYKIVGKNTVVYYANHLNEHTTYKVTVNLETMTEKSRLPLKRYYQKGNANVSL